MEHKVEKPIRKKRKIRLCDVQGSCVFKNSWINNDRCNAEFVVWNTCRHRGDERKV